MEQKHFLQIDVDRLDIEWVEQPMLVYEYGRKLADARFALDEAKAEMEVTEAEVGKDIRLDPKAYGLEKITEAALTTTVKEQKEFKMAQMAYLKAKHRVDVLWAAVSALDHRKKALESLVSLHGQQYFAQPRAKGAAREAMDIELKRQTRTVGHKRIAAEGDDEK